MKALIRKELIMVLKRKKEGKICLGYHTPTRCNERGYTKGDIVSCIIKGKIMNLVEQEYKGKNKLVFELLGKDQDNNQMLLVIAKVGEYLFKVITVTPPIKRGLLD